METNNIKKAKKRKLKTSLIITLLLIAVVLIMAYCVNDIIGSLKSDGEKKVEVLESIKGYYYELNENDSKYFKELFKQLKKELESDNVDEEEYASLLAKLFVTDFYSLEYSINKNDVGGKQFVYKDYQEDFVKYAKDTVYNTVENNVYGKRKQELPNIKEVKTTSIEKKEYSNENGFSDDSAYYVDVKITYDEDMEYPTECSLIIVHSNDKLEIAEME